MGRGGTSVSTDDQSEAAVAIRRSVLSMGVYKLIYRPVILRNARFVVCSSLKPLLLLNSFNHIITKQKSQWVSSPSPSSPASSALLPSRLSVSALLSTRLPSLSWLSLRASVLISVSGLCFLYSSKERS